MRAIQFVVLLAVTWFPLFSQAPEPQANFRVRYVAADAIYLDGGRDEGITEGMELDIRRQVPGDP